jgi:polygalacturonase
MTKRWMSSMLLATMPVLASAQGTEFSVAKYGAKADGVTLATAAIQNAIDAAAAAHGGTVIFPAGMYRTGAVFVKTGVTLRVDKGVTLLGSQRSKTIR